MSIDKTRQDKTRQDNVAQNQNCCQEEIIPVVVDKNDTDGDFENHQEIISRKARERENAMCKFYDNKVGRFGAFGLCNKHYQMYHIHGDAMHFDGRQRPTSNGYYRTGKKGQAEHRKVYEDYYGVKLKPTQIVHHIDFNRTNNEIGNLWLYDSASEHQREHANYRRLRKLYPAENIKFENGKYIYKS